MSLAARIDSEVGHVIDLPIDEFWPKERDAAEDKGLQEEAVALQAAHDDLMTSLVDEEDSMINTHRRHIDAMVTGLKQQMEALNVVDQPGSDVEVYTHSLLAALDSQEGRIRGLQDKLRNFKHNLQQERLLSEKAERARLRLAS